MHTGLTLSNHHFTGGMLFSRDMLNTMDSSPPTKRLKRSVTTESDEETKGSATTLRVVVESRRFESSAPPTISSNPSSGFSAITPVATARRETPDPPPRSFQGTSDAYPARPDVVQFVNVPKSHTNHTYRNFSTMPRDFHYSFPETISSMTFHEKLYHLLTKDSIGTRQSINWSAHGRSFQITSPPKLVRFGVLHAYFGYGMMQQFRKELNKYGYKQLARTAGGTERYYSEFLLRGLPHLLQYSPPPEDRRSLVPDPDNEPDFEEICRLYPLQVDQRELVAEAKANLEAKGIVINDQVFESVIAQRLSLDEPMSPL